MKKTLYRSFLALAAIALLFSAGCKKDDDKTVTDDTASQSVSASDESYLQAETDLASEDANTALGGFSNLSGRYSSFPVICGATIDTSLKDSGIVSINYDGTTACVNGTRKRDGQIRLELLNGARWKDVGAVLAVTFNSYKVTRISDGKSLVLNGTQTITNVTGGLVGNTAQVIHRMRANNLMLTFDNGTTRTWSVARKVTFNSSGPNRAVVIEGDTTVNNIANTVVWGTNRNGDNFYTAISTPLEANNTCGWHKPVAGVKTHEGISRKIMVTLGLDASGNAVSSGCAGFYKIKWTNAQGKVRELLLSY
jgi:hypothetical protein